MATTDSVDRMLIIEVQGLRQPGVLPCNPYIFKVSYASLTRTLQFIRLQGGSIAKITRPSFSAPGLSPISQAHGVETLEPLQPPENLETDASVPLEDFQPPAISPENLESDASMPAADVGVAEPPAPPVEAASNHPEPLPQEGVVLPSVASDDAADAKIPKLFRALLKRLRSKPAEP